MVGWVRVRLEGDHTDLEVPFRKLAVQVALGS
jgi:hypothetical protein